MLALSVPARNAKLNALRGAVDAGNGAAKLCFYSGTRPQAGAAPSGKDVVLLAEGRFSYPCAPSAVDGMLVFNPIGAAAPAQASGRAKWARVYTSTGEFVMDLSTGGPKSGADIEFESKGGEISEGMEVVVPSFVLVEPE